MFNIPNKLLNDLVFRSACGFKEWNETLAEHISNFEGILYDATMDNRIPKVYTVNEGTKNISSYYDDDQSKYKIIVKVPEGKDTYRNPCFAPFEIKITFKNSDEIITIEDGHLTSSHWH